MAMETAINLDGNRDRDTHFHVRQLNRELKAFPGVRQKAYVLWETSVRTEGIVCGITSLYQTV